MTNRHCKAEHLLFCCNGVLRLETFCRYDATYRTASFDWGQQQSNKVLLLRIFLYRNLYCSKFPKFLQGIHVTQRQVWDMRWVQAYPPLVVITRVSQGCDRERNQLQSTSISKRRCNANRDCNKIWLQWMLWWSCSAREVERQLRSRDAGQEIDKAIMFQDPEAILRARRKVNLLHQHHIRTAAPWQGAKEEELFLSLNRICNEQYLT